MHRNRARKQPQYRKSHLTRNQQKLQELMQKVWFGTIWNLPIQNGEPVLSPSVRITQTIKPEEDANGPRPVGDDCALKCQLMIFFMQLGALGDGIVERIEVKYGLPFFFQIEGLPWMFVSDWPQA